ncbi:hypothetical protein [Chitinimonas taiwanensis]|uniref:hypothetical protein n=1 Tax=Chitinimonas taiwanensis TaxID=240412 RepID=UPI001114C838|nr:hypothetical protein [Chitinimonas taiwanensis]
MDSARKKQLKVLGKAEVARSSAEIRAALKEANPEPYSDKRWGENYKRGTLREKWLKQKSPLLHAKKLEELFVVVPNGSAGWQPHLGGYVQCQRCGSVAPSAVRKRWFYWASCQCGNIQFRCVGPWKKISVANPELLIPVKLIGRG